MIMNIHIINIILYKLNVISKHLNTYTHLKNPVTGNLFGISCPTYSFICLFILSVFIFVFISCVVYHVFIDSIVCFVFISCVY